MIKVETYTNENGSNMDCINYKDGVTYEYIKDDLNNMGVDWDYALVCEYSDEGELSACTITKDGDIYKSI